MSGPAPRACVICGTVFQGGRKAWRQITCGPVCARRRQADRHKASVEHRSQPAWAAVHSRRGDEVRSSIPLDAATRAAFVAIDRRMAVDSPRSRRVELRVALSRRPLTPMGTPGEIGAAFGLPAAVITDWWRAGLVAGAVIGGHLRVLTDSVAGRVSALVGVELPGRVDPVFISRAAAAEALGVSPDRLRGMIRRGEIDTIRLPRSSARPVSVESMRRWAAEQVDYYRRPTPNPDG